MLKMRNVQRLNEMLKEVAEVVKAEGVELNQQEMHKAMDITEYEINNENIVNFLVNKLEMEKELNNYKGLAHGIVITHKFEHQVA